MPKLHGLKGRFRIVEIGLYFYSPTTYHTRK